MTGRAVFLDKDGTLVRNVPYNVDPSRVELLPRVGDGLRAMARSGYRLVVVSNQSGVARGLFREPELDAVWARIQLLLAPCGVRIDHFSFCPHHPEGVVEHYARQCACRKPQPGQLVGAARTLGVDLARSWMIGDILDDVEAGNRAGCRSILLVPGGETEWRTAPERMPYARAANLVDAARLIDAADAREAAELRRAEVPA